MIHILDNTTDELIGWIGSVTSDSHKNNISNEETYEFIAPANEPGVSLIGSRTRLIIPGEDGDYREFVVDYTYDKTSSMEKEVYATGSFLDLRKLKIINPQKRTSQTANTAAIYILDGLPWQPGTFDWSDTLDWTIDSHMDAYEALKAIAMLFKFELQFRVTTNGSVVTGRYVDFIRRVGKNDGKEITVGKDLLGIVRKVYSERLVTALYCVGPQKPDGTRYERLVTNNEAYQNWNWKGEHLVGLYEPSNVDPNITFTELAKIGGEELSKRITSVTEYEINAVSLEHILGYEHEALRLGDMSRVKDENFEPPMYLDSRVIFVERSVFNESKKNFKLGEVVAYSKDDIMKTWRGFQALYATKIIRSPIEPPGNSNVLWIKTGGILEVAHSWDVLLAKWIPLNGSITWVMYADDKNGTNISSDPTGKPYIGIAFNQSEETPSLSPEFYTWSLFKGDTGVQGLTGENGNPTYTWIKYADDINGLNMSDDATNKSYIGLAHNKLTTSEGNTPGEYIWALFKGPKGDTGSNGIQGLQGVAGDTGIQGPIGPNGSPAYTHIAYSTSPTGATGFSTTNPAGATYIGMYSDFIASDSDVASTYKWSLIKGADGTQGIQGPTGANGQTSYLHIAYATSANGSTGFSTTDSVNKTYIGQYTDFVSADSTNPSAYSWSLIKGDKGDVGATGNTGLQGIQGPAGNTGIQGPTGPDGKTSYTHIAYSTSSTGSTGFSTTDPAGATHIGMYTDFTAVDSATPSMYKWSLIKGSDGTQGIAGPTGADGKTSYLHIAYATSDNGFTGFSTTDSVNKAYIGQYTDFVSADSLNVASYSWSLIKGDKGETGTQGLQGIQGPTGSTGIQGPVGANGISSYTHIAYATNASGTTGFSTSNSVGATYIGMYTDSTAADSTNPSLYKWTLIKGADGSQGIPGPTGSNGQTSYLHIAYATSADGVTGFSTTISTGKTYIGQYTDFVSADSNSPSVYSWTLIKGDTGAQGPKGDTGTQGIQGLQGTTGNTGIQGPVGANGLTAYTHIAYSTSPTGDTGFSTSDPTNKTYIGMYTDHTAADSATPSSYKWTLIKGADGSQGVEGPVGSNGQTSYLHIAYSTNATGTTGFSTTDSVGKTYIGQYTDFVSADSSTPSLYSWTLIKGATGNTGPTGNTGATGPTGPVGPKGPNIVDSSTIIEADVITSNHINVSNLAAISTDFGTMNAGTINGAVINGAVVDGGQFTQNGGNGLSMMIKGATIKVESEQNYVEINNLGLTIGVADLGSAYYYRPIVLDAYEDASLNIVGRIRSLEPNGIVELGQNGNKLVVLGALDIKSTATFAGISTFNANTTHKQVMTFDKATDTGQIVVSSPYNWTSGIKLKKDGVDRGFMRVEDLSTNHFYIETFSGGGEIRLKTGYNMLRLHNGQVGIYARNADDFAYVPLFASAFTVSSRKEWKKNIIPFSASDKGKTALAEIIATPVYKYNMNEESDVELKHTGLIYEEAPSEILDLTGQGIDLYAMTALLWKAVQELTEKVTILENKKIVKELLNE